MYNSVAAVLIASLCGVALVLQGCGSSPSGTKTCKYDDISVTVTASCSDDYLKVEGETDGVADDICEAFPKTEIKLGGIESASSCKDGKLTMSRKVPLKNGGVTVECTQELIDKQLDATCSAKSSSAQDSFATQTKRGIAQSNLVTVTDDTNVKQLNEHMDLIWDKLGMNTNTGKLTDGAVVKQVRDLDDKMTMAMNGFKVTQGASRPSTSSHATDSIIYVVIGGLVTGLGFFAYYSVVVKHRQARDVESSTVSEPTLEMGPPSSIAA